MKKQYGILSLAAVLLLSSGERVRGDIVLSALDSGWYANFSGGFHDPSNTNYLVGRFGGSDYHDFFVFDLGSVTGTVTAAQLRLFSPFGTYVSPDPSEDYQLFDVSTDITQLRAGGSNQIGIYNDLGAGTVYGQMTLTSAINGTNPPGTIVTIDLNSAGLAALNAAVGGQIAIGGAITTLNGSQNQYAFAFTDDTTNTRELALTTSAVPEPGGLISATLGLAALAGYAGWRRVCPGRTSAHPSSSR